MNIPKYTPEEIARLKKSGLEKVLGHWMCNEDLDKCLKIFTAGEGCDIYDIEGKKYLDTFSSLITNACGHCRPEIKQAVMEQMDRLEFFPNYHDGFAVPLIELAEKLSEITPGDLDVTFFLNSGSEANETAVKMARQYFWQTGRKGKYKVIARRGSYHGTTLGATSFTGFAALREPVEPLLPGMLFAPQVKCTMCELGLERKNCGMACLRELERIIISESPDTVAAIIMDPLPGSNSGYPMPPDGYLKGVRELCDKYDILLIFDEVQTGFGKTGKWFACELWDVVPDILTLSKAITSGYLPLGAAITTPKIASVFHQGPGSEFRSGSTYGGHTLSCAAALANLRIFEEEHLVERAGEIGKYIRAGLEDLYKYPIVGDVQGIGTLWAVELMADRATRRPLKANVGTWIRDWCFDNGMILRNNVNMLVIAPALVVRKDEVDRIMDFLNRGIQAAMKHFNLK